MFAAMTKGLCIPGTTIHATKKQRFVSSCLSIFFPRRYAIKRAIQLDLNFRSHAQTGRDWGRLSTKSSFECRCQGKGSRKKMDVESEIVLLQGDEWVCITYYQKCRKLNPTCRKKSVTSLIKQQFFMVNSKNSSIQKYCLV